MGDGEVEQFSTSSQYPLRFTCYRNEGEETLAFSSVFEAIVYSTGDEMEFRLIEINGEKQVVYDSVVISPAKLKVLGSKLSLKIIRELASQPCCPMDLSRRLKEHEQKIYYHIRRLKKAGIIKRVRKEKRSGMTANIYRLVSPVVSVKLSNGGVSTDTSSEQEAPDV
jgi:DNA-binding transcriptional ArsR family regulator